MGKEQQNSDTNNNGSYSDGVKVVNCKQKQKIFVKQVRLKIDNKNRENVDCNGFLDKILSEMAVNQITLDRNNNNNRSAAATMESRLFKQRDSEARSGSGGAGAHLMYNNSVTRAVQQRLEQEFHNIKPTGRANEELSDQQRNELLDLFKIKRKMKL